MRSLSTVLALGLCSYAALWAETNVSIAPQLTVLLSIEGKSSPSTLAELKSELGDIMKDTGRTLDVRLRQDAAPTESFQDVVLVSLKGTCKMEKLQVFSDERGPLAWTHSTDGAVLPFAEVSCDRIARSVASELWGGQRNQADKYLGRALGRVLAHELYHILGQTHEHNLDGSVAKEALSAKQLISDKRIGFDVRDLNRMIP
ncbi:hypothetical protein [Bryobacter aggregatus]|uniref:hypothetical protein n=1 Tax=Bryobacter aggregatus TaxID=360054 RepID=UPI0004E19CBF|nr:hypothetical protein [Bryobacter aggregatus]